jgi:hypothetical protein
MTRKGNKGSMVEVRKSLAQARRKTDGFRLIAQSKFFGESAPFAGEAHCSLHSLTSMGS